MMQLFRLFLSDSKYKIIIIIYQLSSSSAMFRPFHSLSTLSQSEKETAAAAAAAAAARACTRQSIVRGTLSSPICTFICQDQLLVLAVFLSCPLERGGSQLERGAGGYALSPLCGETHGGLERLSAGAERKSEREHTWGGWFFSIFFHTKVSVFFFFFEGPFRCRDISCQKDRFF